MARSKKITSPLIKRSFIRVASSNISEAAYEPDKLVMTLRYKGGATYEYWLVSPSEWQSFLLAPSKGSWSWDFLRVRGSKTLHQKNYRRVE
jgi:hypothetical protein